MTRQSSDVGEPRALAELFPILARASDRDQRHRARTSSPARFWPTWVVLGLHRRRPGHGDGENAKFWMTGPSSTLN